MSSSWDEFVPSKIRTLGAVGRFWAKIDHGTPLESIFSKNHFLIIFDFWIVGLWTLSAEFWFIWPNIGRSVIFSENIPIKVLSPKNAAVRTLNLLPYTIFCEFSPNSIFYNILRLGEEFFARSSYEKLFLHDEKLWSLGFPTPCRTYLYDSSILRYLSLKFKKSMHYHLCRAFSYVIW